MNRRLALFAAFGLALATQAAAAPSLRPTGASGEAASACPPGFAALQGSGTCVRVSGRVRADALAGSADTRTGNAVGTEVSGRVQLDVRKQTEYGPLRAVIRAEGVRQQ